MVLVLYQTELRPLMTEGLSSIRASADWIRNGEADARKPGEAFGGSHGHRNS